MVEPKVEAAGIEPAISESPDSPLSRDLCACDGEPYPVCHLCFVASTDSEGTGVRVRITSPLSHQCDQAGHGEEVTESLCEDRESGYGLLLRTVTSTLEESDPGAVQALHRAAGDIEQMVSTLRLCREVVGRYGNYWCKDDAYYAVAETLGLEQ